MSPSANRPASSGRRTAPSRGAGGLPAIGGALLLVLGLGWLVVTLNLADEAVRTGQPDKAIALAPGSARAAAAAAEQSLNEDRPRVAIAQAQRAVINSPLSVAGLRSWGLAAQMAGDPLAASRLMGQAASLGWRDVPTQLWLIAAAMQARDYTATMLYVDALTRTVGLDPRVQNVLDGLAASPDAHDDFIRMLARNPSWRGDYFAQMRDLDGPRLLLRAAALQALVGTRAPPTRAEVRDVVNILVSHDASMPAFALWQRVTGAKPNAIVDPEFRDASIEGSGTTPFQWRVFSLAGASISVDETANGGRVLHASGDGSASGAIAREIVVLTPGPHRLAVQARFAPPAAADAFRLRVRCIGPGGLVFRSEPPRPGVSEPLTLDMTVPADGSCETQSLEIVIQRSNAAGRVEGWFERVAAS